MNIIPFTLSLSLFDSLSTAQQIIIFALMLTTTKPLHNSLAFLAGLIGSYFVCGLFGYLAFDFLNAFLANYFPSTANLSNTNYYQFEFIFGIAMAFFGVWYYRKKRHASPGSTQNILVSKLKSMNVLFALGIGIFISVTSFPFSIPYIIALGKYSTLHLSFATAIGYNVLYNIGYALPMIVIFIIYLFARRNTDDLSGTIHEKTRVLNVRLTTWTLLGVGIFSMIDSGCYFAIGHALVKGRFL